MSILNARKQRAHDAEGARHDTAGQPGMRRRVEHAHIDRERDGAPQRLSEPNALHVVAAEVGNGDEGWRADARG